MKLEEIKKMCVEKEEIEKDIVLLKKNNIDKGIKICNSIQEMSGPFGEDIVELFKDMNNLNGFMLKDTVHIDTNMFRTTTFSKHIPNWVLKYTGEKTLRHIAANMKPELLEKYNIDNIYNDDFDIVDDMLVILTSTLKDITNLIWENVSVEKKVTKVTKTKITTYNKAEDIEALLIKMYDRMKIDFTMGIIDRASKGLFYEEATIEQIDSHLATDYVDLGRKSKYILFILEEFILDIEPLNYEQLTLLYDSDITFLRKYYKDLKKLEKSVSYKKYDRGDE